MRLGRDHSPPPLPWLSRCIFILVPLTFLGLVACARLSVAPAEPAGNQVPAWTYRKPDDPNLLVGLGRAPLSGDVAKAKETALALARDDLLEAAKASARRWTYQAAQGVDPSVVEGLWEQLVWDRQEADIASMATAEFYEEAGRGRVWVLVSMSREAFEGTLTSHRAEIGPMVASRLSKADGARRKGNLVQELTALATALSPLVGPEGLTLPSTTTPGRLLRQEVEDRLKAAAAAVKVSVVDTPASLSPGVVNATLVARAASTSGDPLAIPLAFSFVKGVGDRADAVGADSKGRTSAVVKAVNAREPEVLIQARLDLSRLVDGGEVERKLVERATAPWQLPSTQLLIAVIPVKLLLTYIERGGTGGRRGALLVDELAAAFAKAGADTVDLGVGALSSSRAFEQIARGEPLKDTAGLPDVDLIGVALVELTDYDTQGRAPVMHAASGAGSFRLYDPRVGRYRMEVSTGTMSFSGFSQTDAERGFFLQASDRLRDKVSTEIEGHDLLGD